MFLIAWIGFFMANFSFKLIHDAGLFILLTVMAALAAYGIMLLVRFTWPVMVLLAVIIATLKLALP
jgi:hypothetical protein